MAGEGFLPPVVISIAVNDSAALAQLAGLKGAMAETSASIGGSAGKVGKDLEGMGTGAATGASGVKAAESGAESASKGFSGRMAMMFESLGNSMSSFGLPFGNSVKKMGYSMKEGESAGKGFSSSLASLAKVAALAGLAIVAGVAVMSIKAADQFDVAQNRLKQAVTDLGKSFKSLEPQISQTEKTGVKFGFTMTETAESLAKLTVATKDPTKAMGLMGTAMDLARFKHISLSQASETLTKVMAGSNRALLSLGINLNIGSAKLATVQKATEAVTKAKQTLVTAEKAVSEAVAKGAEEHQAALAKVTAAEETLKSAQETLKGGSEGLTSAQTSLATAQKGVTEAAEKQKLAVKEAAAAVKSAEAAAREAAEQGAKGIAEAKKNLGNLETERSKEGNEAGIKQIETEEKVLEATKSVANEAALVQLRAKKGTLEATDKGMEATKKEEALQTAHKGIIEAEATAHKNNRTAISAVDAAHKKLIKSQQEEAHGSKESVTAANALATAHRGVSAAERTLAKDQEAVGKATRGVTTAQEAANKTSTAVVKAEEKLKAAHEALSKAQSTLAKDSGTVQKVMEALHKYLGGQATVYVHSLAGQWDVFKAKLNETEISLGNKMIPTLEKLTPLLPKIGNAINGLVSGFVWFVSKEIEGWEKIGIVLGRVYYGTLQPIVKGIIHLFTSIGDVTIKVVSFFVNMDIGIIKVIQKIGKGIADLIGFFVSLPAKVVGALASLLTDMVSFGAHIVEAIVHGITSAPGAIVNAIKGLIPGGGIVGDVGKVLGLAKGGIVTKPTLAVVGEAGPEMVVPLKGIATDGVKPLGTQGQQSQQQSANGLSAASGGLHIDNLTVNGMSTPSPVVVSELYSRLRPLLI